eukprot:gnl/TRDRNA2_/TRDRNA2_28944_c0_seq1.p1 gnl/TRDRNA2_/TRDRNA2_28944_c0~~gnl/TRDRNA2_/TRDRNA2_28944_c0_seq1.p1  ORF type:complete len:292 (-),score=66.98 gnl/TRDRNA2_/TRDRNA2_28944_c0_seq1:117-992(-)
MSEMQTKSCTMESRGGEFIPTEMPMELQGVLTMQEFGDAVAQVNVVLWQFRNELGREICVKTLCTIFSGGWCWIIWFCPCTDDRKFREKAMNECFGKWRAKGLSVNVGLIERKCKHPEWVIDVGIPESARAEKPGQVVAPLQQTMQVAVAPAKQAESQDAALVEFLKKTNCEEYGAKFAAEGIGFKDLQSLSEQDLVDLGVTLGPRKRMLAEREESLRSAALTSPHQKELSEPEPSPPEVQPTDPRCDLSTSVSEKEDVDPKPKAKAFCPECGTKNDTGAKFCGNCGAKLV